MSIAKRCAATKPAAFLGTLVTVFLLRSCGAFVMPPAGASTRGTPADRVTGYRSAFRGESLGWTRAADRTALPGHALDDTSSSFEPPEILLDDGEQGTRKAAISSALAQMGDHEGGAGGGGGREKGGGRAGGGGLWKNGFRQARGAVARMWKRGDSKAAAGGDQQKVEEEVAMTSTAVDSPLVSHEPSAGGRMVPPAIVEVNTGDVPRLLHGMLGDDDFDRQQRVMILMSDTGRGHYESAEALREGLHELYPFMVNVNIVDIWTERAPLLLNMLVGSFQSMAECSPVWKALWELSRFPPARRVSDDFMNIRCHKRVRSIFEHCKPDLVVSVHPTCQEVPLRVLKKMGGGTRKIPFVTVVTDLGGAHPAWFHRDVDACFVPSKRLAIRARKCGLAPDQVRLHGPLTRPGFWRKQLAKTELQEELGLNPGVKTCLVLDGGDGDGGLESIADSVGRRLGQDKMESQVVVCGGSRVVKASLESAKWASNVHVHVKGYVPDMHNWMGAMDCIVTRADSVIIGEAMVRGLPIMLSAVSPGQEEGNVPYVVEGGFGSFSQDPTEIGDTISEWLGDDELLARMSSKAKQASQPMATELICEDIGDMLVCRDDSVGAAGRCTLVIDTFIAE